VAGRRVLIIGVAALPALRTIVVRGSAAIYGSEPDGPAFFTEDDARPAVAEDRTLVLELADDVRARIQQKVYDSLVNGEGGS
jgi:hypothetical protein